MTTLKDLIFLDYEIKKYNLLNKKDLKNLEYDLSNFNFDDLEISDIIYKYLSNYSSVEIVYDGGGMEVIAIIPKK